MSVLDLADVVDSLGTGTIKVVRAVTGPTRVRGNVVSGSKQTLNINAIVQPAKPRDLLRLPEGERTREVIVIFTKEELRTSSTAENRVADVVCYRDRNYELLMREDWQEQSGHFRCMAGKVEAA